VHYGHKPHRHSPEDLTILWCRCGWVSGELTRAELRDRGMPWYCDDCGKQGLNFIHFHPTEREAALREVPMAKPTLIKPNGEAAGLRADQKECIALLKGLLDDAEQGKIWSCVVVACGPDDFGSAMAGSDAPRLNLGLDVAKSVILERVAGKRTVLHR
jgi:hypothetical protein